MSVKILWYFFLIICSNHNLCEFYLQLSIVVSDTGVPPLTSSQRASVIINVVRNQFPPNFINTPYATTINRTVLQGTTVYTVSAVDQDIQVWINLELITYNKD